MKAAGYIRLSQQDQSSSSIDNQRRGILEYCQKNNLDIIDFFEDNGESSYTFDRADFKRLELYIKKSKPDFIIVYHLDRFSRNLAEALLKIKELLNKFNVRIRDITEPLDLDDNDPNTFLMRSFRFMMAESELHRITKRIKDGMMQGALNGRHLNMAPYGYKNSRDKDNKPTLIINEEKASIVQLIFRQYIAGNSIETVRAIAKKAGFTQHGTSAIQRILSNQIYLGKVKLPQSAKYVNGLHEPIISEFEFWQAQNLLGARGKITHQANKEVFLRGVLKDHTGHIMTAGNSRGKTGKYYWYYVSKITKQNLSAVKLHDQFFKLLEAIQLDTKEVAWLKEKLISAINEKIGTQAASIHQISKKLDEVKNRIAVAEGRYLLDQDISQASYRKVIDQLQSKQNALQLDLMNCEQPASHLLKKMDDILPLLSNIKDAFQNLSLTKQQQFINAGFNYSLSYYNDTYRTQFLHPLFSSKVKLLKEKRLLIVEQPSIKLGATPIRTRDGS